MELIKIAQKIEAKINHLQEKAKEIDELATERAQKSADYEKALAICIMKLRNGEGMELDGNYIQNPSVSVTEKLAKGMCWKEKIEMDSAETDYKNCLKKIDIIKAQLNGYQSINKYLAEM